MKYILFLAVVLVSNGAFAQAKLPLIKATSRKVAIRDGEDFDKNAWNLSPQLKPDVFTAARNRKSKWVTFYTDIDSIKVKVKPGSKFDFVIVLNGKDSCYTRIESAIPASDPKKDRIVRADTIPFVLTAFNAIAVKAVINGVDTLNLHFDTGSWDFSFTKTAILRKTHLLSNQPDVIQGKTTPNYNTLNPVSKLQMGALVWTNPKVAPTDLTAHEMDGRFGWNLFEGKAIEVNYDHNILIVHSGKYKVPKGYSPSKLSIKNAFVLVNGHFEIQSKQYFGEFLLDTGSELAIILDGNWMHRQNFPFDLPLIKSTVLRNPRGEAFEIKIVKTPVFNINGYDLSAVPASILNKNPAGFEVNNLGNGFLKRFNMVLDFKNDIFYVKPNQWLTARYKENS